MLFKPKNTGDKKKILKTARETRQIAYKARIIRSVTDFSKQPTTKVRGSGVMT